MIKRIEEARANTENLPGTPPTIQDGCEHVENQNYPTAFELQFQQFQRQVQELLDRESPQDGLLSATQLTQVQSIVQGSLNEAIEKAASTAAQAAVSTFNGFSPPAIAPPTQASDSFWNHALKRSSPGLNASPQHYSATDLAVDSVHELPAKLVKEILTAIQKLGQGCYKGKTDVESAFRLFSVHLDDSELLGMLWAGSYYIDKVLPFGLRSAPYIFNQLSDAIEWILLNKCYISFVCHNLDDFLIVEPPCPTHLFDSLCQASLSSMLHAVFTCM